MYVRKTLIIVGVYTSIAVLSSVYFHIFDTFHGAREPFFNFLLMVLSDWYLWAAFTPLIYWIVKRYPIRSGHLLTDIPINIVLSVSVVMMKQFVDALIIHFLLGDSMPMPRGPEFAPEMDFGDTLNHGLFSPKVLVLFLVYWIIVSVIYIIQYNRQLKERELTSSRLETHLARAQLQALQMQIQPHFLFNTLNSISSLLRQNVDAADEMLAKLSDMLRYTLNHDDVQLIPLKEEIDFLICYLDIEIIRYQDRLAVVFDIDKEIENSLVPYMLLQPLVENSVRHGISQKSSQGILSVRARIVGKDLEIIVKDNGPGMQVKNKRPIHEGIGISTTRKRLSHLYGSDFCLEFASPDNKGTTVRIRLPLTLNQVEESCHEPEITCLNCR